MTSPAHPWRDHAGDPDGLRPDLRVISDWIAPGSRVLDLGCGDGTLMDHLQRAKGCKGYGVEIDDEAVLACTRRGVSVIQQNIEAGLGMFGETRFDVVVLSMAIQATNKTEQVLREMSGIGREGIVSFPNFGHWFHAWSLLRGHMPVSKEMPYHWYDTPNLHLSTIADFEAFLDKLGLAITARAYPGQRQAGHRRSRRCGPRRRSTGSNGAERVRLTAPARRAQARSHVCATGGRAATGQDPRAPSVIAHDSNGPLLRWHLTECPVPRRKGGDPMSSRFIEVRCRIDRARVRRWRRGLPGCSEKRFANPGTRLERADDSAGFPVVPLLTERLRRAEGPRVRTVRLQAFTGHPLRWPFSWPRPVP